MLRLATFNSENCSECQLFCTENENESRLTCLFQRESPGHEIEAEEVAPPESPLIQYAMDELHTSP